MKKLKLVIKKYETNDLEDEPNFNFIVDKISEEISLPAKDIILCDSQSGPAFDVWTELNILSALGLKSIPLGKYFNIPESSSSFGFINIILESILSSDDIFTRLKNCCIIYRKPKPDSLVFVEIYGLTTSGCRRDKSCPFIVGYIFPFGTIKEDTKLLDFEGLYHIIPRKKKFNDSSNKLQKINNSVSRDVRNGLVKSLKRNLPPGTDVEVLNFSKDSVPAKFNSGISCNSLGIVKISDVPNPTAVFIVSFSETQVLIDLLKPVGHSSTKWKHTTDCSTWYPLSSLLVTSVPADQISQDTFLLRNTPKTILKQLKIDV